MKEKTKKAISYLLDRLGEASTWQGIGFLIVLCGGKFGANLDWGQAAGLGGALSATIKMMLPDSK